MGCFTVISFCFIRGNKHFTSEGVKGHFTKNVLSINLIRASCWWLNGLEVNLFLMLLFDLQHQRSIKTSPDEFWWAAPGSIQVAVKSWVHPSVAQYSCSTDLSIKLHVFTLSCSVLLLCYQITAASQVLAGRLWHRSTRVRWRYVSGNMLTQAKTDCEHPPAADTASSTSTQVFHHSGHVSTRPQRTQLWCSSTCGLRNPLN